MLVMKSHYQTTVGNHIRFVLPPAVYQMQELESESHLNGALQSFTKLNMNYFNRHFSPNPITAVAATTVRQCLV